MAVTEILNVGQSKLVPVTDVSPHPRNANQGDVGAIHQSIERNGFYGALVVQKSSGHVLVGNHRLEAARHAGIKRVPVIYVDVDDETALRILLADNRTARLGLDDDAVLLSVLKELAAGGGIDGTGYDGDDLDDLVKRLEGDDDFIRAQRDAADGYEEQYGVIVVCTSEEHQAQVYEQLRAAGHAVKVVVT